ncbi:MAG TPA: hypothetical protein PKD72_09265, partial [Gemmatales bacterium]|nr:hypothetical protein [Gemmatales bacterium]
PHLSAAEQADPGGVGNGIRQPLVQAVEWWLRNPSRTRSDGVERAIRFLTQFQETLLAPAREELSAVSLWETWVTEGAKTYADRYQNEHLTGEQFPHFQAAMVRLMELLELPGVGQYVSKAMHLLRSPYRWVKSGLSKPTSQTQVETQVLQAGFQGWLDRLRHHLLQQDREQTVWNTLYQAYQQQADQALLGAFEQRVAEFSKKQSVEVEATARSIYEELEKNPSALNTLRGLKFSVEAASLTGVVLTAGTHLLLYPLLLPLVASVTHAVTEGLGKQYVDSQREKSRNRLLHLFGDTVVQPMEKELKQWPEKLLPDLPRLREITSRLPAHLASLQKQLQAMPRREVA